MAAELEGPVTVDDLPITFQRIYTRRETRSGLIIKRFTFRPIGTVFNSRQGRLTYLIELLRASMSRSNRQRFDDRSSASALDLRQANVRGSRERNEATRTPASLDRVLDVLDTRLVVQL
ncbi:hypothetical protein EVAR_40201_1 [Eumeta japonica]|uniref:Uncharacterized protein n=1 Tax=Eumeta variegata TaxID=151549 RepID=A0A4C1XLG4_EUMVA|nr:hypothetical protein EVAR_40201_1 [Eumeta japonica]